VSVEDDECSTFSVTLLELGRPSHSSSSTDTQLALKHDCHQGTTVMFSKSLRKHLKGFGSGLTELRTKPDADLLLSFATQKALM
jgi:hypothetical protein